MDSHQFWDKNTEQLTLPQADVTPWTPPWLEKKKATQKAKWKTVSTHITKKLQLQTAGL